MAKDEPPNLVNKLGDLGGYVLSVTGLPVRADS